MNAFETTYQTALKAAEATNNAALMKLVKLAESTRIKMGITEDTWAELGDKLMKVCDYPTTIVQKKMCSSTWAAVPMLHPKTPSLYGGVASSTATKYGTAEIDKYCLLDCEQMFRESWSEKSLDELLCFQINNNGDCFCFRSKDMVNVVTDAKAKLPIKESFVYGCEPKNIMFLGRPLYGVAFCDPEIEKRKRTIYPPCLFSEAITSSDVGDGGLAGEECPYMDTNTYWFFDRQKWFKFTALALGVETFTCDECGYIFDKKEVQEFVYKKTRWSNQRRITVCCDCVQIAENKIRAEEECAKSKYENALRMAEPARATAEAQLLEMLKEEDKEIIVKVKAETPKERNKRLAAEAAKELKAEKKRKEDYLKAIGQYKSPEQLKKEKDARLKAEIAQMGKRK